MCFFFCMYIVNNYVIHTDLELSMKALYSHFNPKVRGYAFLRNVGNHLLDYMVSQSRKPHSTLYSTFGGTDRNQQ
jgi:hypothetical protein